MSISVLCVAYQSHSVWSASWLPLILLQYLHSQWQRLLRKIILTSFGVCKLQLSLFLCFVWFSMNESLRNQFLAFSQTPYAAMSVSLSNTVPFIGSLSLSLFFALSLSLSLSFPLYQFLSLILSFFNSITYHSITYLPIDILCRHPMDLSTMANKSTRYVIFP